MAHGYQDEDVWATTDIGGRSRMEDAHFLELNLGGVSGRILAGIFDGHGGPEVAEYASSRFPSLFQESLAFGLTPDRALEGAFLTIDEETIGMRSGSVAAVLFLDGAGLTIANVGDAEVLLVSETRQTMLTEMHRLSNDAEKMRIIESGGHIEWPYVMHRSGYGLQCTRSLGDHAFKEVGILPNPHISRMTLGGSDIWMVAACDGLWDVMRPAEVAAMARKETTARGLAEALRHEALTVRRTSDNLTIMILRVMPELEVGKA